MASKPTTILTQRDLAILGSLSKTPLDARQVLEISSTFSRPFTHERLVRRRLQRLAEAGFASRFHYATFGSGAVNYYKLAPLGFRMLHGTKTTMPRRRYFKEVSLGLQEHTRSLADFVVRTYVAAHRAGIAVPSFWRENELQLSLGAQKMQPDCAFQLVTATGETYNYLVEIDCCTEPIRSTKQRESLERKIRFFDRYQAGTDKRFRVLVLFTKPSSRLHHFLQTVADIVGNPQRLLFYGAQLREYLDAKDSLRQPVFFDHHHQPQSLLPSPSGRRTPRRPKRTAHFMVEAARIW